MAVTKRKARVMAARAKIEEGEVVATEDTASGEHTEASEAAQQDTSTEAEQTGAGDDLEQESAQEKAQTAGIEGTVYAEDEEYYPEQDDGLEEGQVHAGTKTRKRRTKADDTTPANLQCSVCGKFLASRQKYMDHMRYHSTQRVNCEFCEKAFYRSAQLKRHIVVLHPEQIPTEDLETLQKEVGLQLTCKICFRVFRAKSSLHYHMQLHKGELKHNCATCGYQCISGSALRQHEMTHDSTCVRCLNCHRLFKDMEEWKIHAERVHPNEEPKATMNAAAFTEKHTTLRKNRCLDEEGNMRIRFPEEDVTVAPKAKKPRVSKKNELEVEFITEGEQAVDANIEGEGKENTDTEAGKGVPAAKKFTMYQCIPCNVVFFGKDGLVDHYLQDHEDMTRSVEIFFTSAKGKEGEQDATITI